MKKTLAFVMMSAAAMCVTSFGATAIGGSLKILSATTNKEISSVRIGQKFKIKVSESNLNLLANKNVTFTYLFSVVPKGSGTPISFSGKWVATATLPKSEGGAAKTKKEMASLAGTQGNVGVVVLPDFIPEGVATLTVSVSSPGVGVINISKTLNILL